MIILNYLNILNKLLNFLNSEKFLELKKLSIINKLKSLLHVWNVNNIYYSWFSFKNSPNQVLIFSKLFVTFYSKFELKSLSDTQKLAFLKNSIK